MSTVPRRRGSSPTDRFRYGWRDVPQYDERGRFLRSVQVPLTREDVLHPQMGDVILQNDPHDKDRTYLRNVLTAWTVADPHAVVLSDCGVYWDVVALGHHSPDIAVIFGVREQRRWDTFSVVAEGVRPSLLIEITSRSTRSTDLREKRRDYFRAGVPVYAIVDSQETNDERVLEIIGYRPGKSRYQRLPLNDQGRLWLEAVQLWLGADNGRVVCYDAQGQRIEDYTKVLQDGKAAKQEAAEERQRAAQERQRAEQERQQAEQERQRADQERQRADQERQRAEQERHQTEQERQRADAAEQRLRELEVELRRARGEA